MELVTVVNRTSKKLQGTWDGRHYDIQPGSSAHPRLVAEAFKRQNTKNGSENPRTGDITYLVGIKEDGDDCSPMEQDYNAVERWDRSTMPLKQQNVEIVPGDNGIFSARDVRRSLPLDSSFVKP